MPSLKAGLPLAEARTFAKEVTSTLARLGVEVEVTGSLLREDSFIGDLDLLVFADLEPLATKIRADTDWVIVSGGSNSLTLVAQGQQLNLFRVNEDCLGAARMTYTGPKHYVIAYRMKAKKKGWTLNQYGLFDENNVLLEAKSEERIYQLLGKEWKHPNRRGKR